MTYFAFLFLVEIIASAAMLLAGLSVPTPHEYEEVKGYSAEPIQLRKAA